MSYPQITLKKCDYALITQNKTGDLAIVYKPLQNLILDFTLGDFTTKNLNFDRYNYQDMVITDEFDGTTNIIINDDTNSPKLINSGFAVLEDNTFLVPEHYTNVVDNIYDDVCLSEDTQLLKLYKTIPSVQFNGLGVGNFKCGSYVFYFRLADSHGNMSNVIQHSSIVLLPVGENGTYKLRMGMLDENANKSVYFTLTNIDSGFDYIRVFYERTSTANDLADSTLFYMVDQNFPISNGKCEIRLTGEEPVVDISLLDLKNEYADIASCKTLTIVDNVLFMGNTSAYEHDYKALLHIAWSIFVEQEEDSIELPDTSATGDAKGYYDLQNVYSKVGYWPDEYYRFGIVFIYNNNLLSPVFNIQGYDLSKVKDEQVLDYILNKVGNKYEFYDAEPEDYFFNASIYSNSKGVVKLKPLNKGYKTKPNTEYLLVKIKFNTEGLQEYIRHSQDLTDTEREEYLADEIKQTYDVPRFLNLVHGIKGFFFVRLKRIPTVIALGMVIGLTKKDFGSIPVLQNDKSWSTKSFISEDRLILKEGTTITVPSENVFCKAILIPDAELQEATFNLIFTGQDFSLWRQNTATFKVTGDWWEYKTLKDADSKSVISTLTAVPKDTKIITNGKDYFSTIAGTPEESFKTEDVKYSWEKTAPQYLTLSTSLIRGRWGYYVGLGTDEFNFGDIINIKAPGFKSRPEIQNLLEFLNRFSDFSLYSPVSTRYSVNTINKNIECFGGDCFPSMFTHRMMTNFIDPELPTNTRIVDPGCWAKNYAVRCTAEILSGAHSNLTGDSAGFYVPSPVQKASNIVSLVFGILTGNLGIVIKSANDLISLSKSDRPVQDTFANEVATSFEVYTGISSTDATTDMFSDTYDENYGTDNKDTGWDALYSSLVKAMKEGQIKKVNPKEQELNASGLNLKALFKSDDKWELRGVAQINRADVNAVSFGQWVTFPIMSSMNLALRDIDFNNATEEAKFNKKRSFYPLEPMDTTNKIFESNVINGAAKKTVHKNTHPAYKTVPFIKLEYFNRIYWSKPNISESFLNSFRLVYSDQYKEYNKEFGTITKILPLGNSLFVCFTHGMGVLPIDRSIKTETEASPYLASRNVLPSQVLTLSKDFGSMWKNSVIQTPSGVIYGVDTVAKKIWRTQGSQVEFISDHNVTKFLNDFITLSEFDYKAYQGHLDVKTHYNNFKNDVIFTFVKDVPTYDSPSLEKLEELRFYMRQMWCSNRNDSVYFGVYKKGKIDGDGTMDVIFGLHQYDVDLNGFELVTDSNGVTLAIKDGDEHPIGSNLTIKTLEIQNGKVYINDLFTGVWLDIKKWDPGNVWSLCFNEKLNKFITFYDWYPVESCNVDNIFFSFDQENIDHVYNKDLNSDVHYPKILKAPDGDLLKYQISNKYFIDKTFSDSVKIRRLNDGDTYEIDTNNKSFLSFYYKLEKESSTIEYGNGNIREDYSEAVNNQLKLEDGWKFAVLSVNPYLPTISLTPSDGYIDIVELKTFTDLPIDPESGSPYTWSDYQTNTRKNAENLRYYEIRDYNSNRLYLWKHGLAGLYNNQGEIKPTNWYGKQREFNFEFVVNDIPTRQKIFNNLKMVSNKTQPKKFEYEIVGEGYEWWPYKPVIHWVNDKVDKGEFPNLDAAYIYVLSNDVGVIRKKYPDFPTTILEYKMQLTSNPYLYKKLPYLRIELTDRKGRRDRSYHPDAVDYWQNQRPVRDDLPRRYDYTFNTNETVIKYDPQLNEYRVHDEQLGNDMWKYGRVRGNMQYLEDLWDIEIRPITFEWCYLLSSGGFFMDNGTVSPVGQVTNVVYNGEKLDSILPENPILPITFKVSGKFNKGLRYQFKTILRNPGKGEITINVNDATCEVEHSYGVDFVGIIPNKDLTELIITVTNSEGLVFYKYYSTPTHIELKTYLNTVDHKLELVKKTVSETRHRDKYIKVKVRYSGDDLAVIQQIYTLFDESYA